MWNTNRNDKKLKGRCRMIKKKMNIYNDESETAMAFSLFFISIRQVQDGKRNRKDISRKKKKNQHE